MVKTPVSGVFCLWVVGLDSGLYKQGTLLTGPQPQRIIEGIERIVGLWDHYNQMNCRHDQRTKLLARIASYEGDVPMNMPAISLAAVDKWPRRQQTLEIAANRATGFSGNIVHLWVTLLYANRVPPLTNEITFGTSVSRFGTAT